jgi:two-component SAPR family response regulator
MGFYLRDVMRAFIPYMQPFSDALGMEDASQLACRIADVLVERGNPDRAAQVLVTVCEPTLRARWVARHQAQLADRCAFVALEALYASLRQTGLERQVGLRIGTAVCEGLLADAAEGTDKLTRIARKGEASLGERLIAAMAALLLSEDARAYDELCAIGMMNGVAMTDADVPAAFGSVAFFWLRTPHADGIEEVAAYVCEQAESSSVSALVAACCLKAARLKRAGDPGLWVTLMMMVERAVQRCAVERNHGGAVAVLRRELSACKKGGLSVWVPKALTDDERLDELERRLNQQRVFYARRRGSSESMERPIASISASVDELPQVGSVPILRIHLFGRFDVTVGDAHADPALFSRQKVRTLLALLALDVGKDVSCEALCKELWPEATLAKSSHNFHSIFSLLRKAIALPSGECPYLTRSQGACSLDGMCVVSDAFELDQVCRSLRFDTSDERTFQRHYERICEIYQGEFLPGEKNEGVVAAKRDYWRNRVVDALIYAVKALVPIGEKRMALQFSRTALEYDPRREDCYGVLMAMQAICGERPHASNTWMRYCHFIDKDMGLDPSARLRTLYSQIIKDSWESEGELLADL